MVQDNPKQEELHEMIKFIAQNKQIYIYMGDIILAKNISKYLYYARIQFCGFIKPEIYDCDRDSEPMPIINYAELRSYPKVKSAIRVLLLRLRMNYTIKLSILFIK